jgi:DNA-directed RNA polymerase subunit RPC12/RpoP
MALSCPACGAAVTGSPERRLLRCGACGARIKTRPVSGEGERAYEVEVLGRAETRRRVELPWTPADTNRLHAWLVWSSAVTVGLAGLLYLLARFWD